MTLRTAYLSITNPADTRLLSAFLSELDFRVEIINEKDLPKVSDGKVDMVIADLKTAAARRDYFCGLKNSSPVFLPILLLLPKNMASISLQTPPFDDVIRIPISKIEFETRIHAFLHLREQSELIVHHSEQKYRSFFENTGTAIAIIEEDLTISQVNAQFEKLSGYEREEIQGNKLWTEFIDRHDVEHFMEYHRMSQLGEKFVPHHYELRFINKQREVRDILITASLIPSTRKTLASLIDITKNKRAERELQQSYKALEKSKRATLNALEDLRAEYNEREKAEQALRESEEKFRILSESTSSAIFIYKGEKFIYVNPATEKVTGYSKEELLHMHFWDVVHPDHRDKIREDGLARQSGQDLPTNYEFKILHKDGTEKWINFSAGMIFYQGEAAAIGTAFDITEKKRAQAAIKQNEKNLRALTGRLLKVREEERVSISRELHDYLGQGLTALKIDLATLKRKILSQLPGKNTTIEELQKASDSLIDDLINWVRKLSADLRPPLLDEFGLLAAIELWANKFMSNSKIKYKMSTQVEDFKMKPDDSIAVYRIFQEMITNIVRHSQASVANVKIFERGEETILHVRDNGIGMETATTKHSQSLGLLGMFERTELFGGHLDIKSKSGKGTEITLSIPNKCIIR